ncbi:hypothetical protein [Moheibacter sediminis]|uniref:Outer membrane protein beta-barrel domain-containing protein n=1 Tax=Moheibacter sediminis TaxID=1434700 RepID=A0A1W2AFT9_9FLAO|nr:hypothetical protein [Moheibacter sediminis]SMC59483.1 hypothetical protein SAMN06296427_104122 [Moheibacter sediminis]
MKKLFLTAAIAVFGLVGVNAQFEAGAYLGAPIGDSDGASLNAGATFAYYVPIVEGLKIGGIAGVDHFFGKDYRGFDYPDATFIPIAASAKYNFNPKLFVGLDLGYAIGVSDGAGDGGFLVRPRFGFSLPIVDLYAYYKSISYSYDSPGNWNNNDWDWDDTWNLGSVGVGASFKF